jgi:hypothetical protein
MNTVDAVKKTFWDLLQGYEIWFKQLKEKQQIINDDKCLLFQ